MSCYICESCNNWVDLDTADVMEKAANLGICQRCYEENEMTNTFDIYLNGKRIDTVFSAVNTAEEARVACIEDGYDPAIKVKPHNPERSA